jgi:hypothetical protein
MPRNVFPASPARRAVFTQALEHLKRLGRIPANVEIDSFEHPIYVLAADQVGKAPGANAARMVGWRYFAVSAAPKTVVAADISDGSPPMLLNVSQGSQAAAEYESVKEADSLDEIKTENFELRALRVPGALSQSIWLKLADSDGLLVPFGISFIQTDARRQFTMEEYLHWIRPTEPIPRVRADAGFPEHGNKTRQHSSDTHQLRP